MPAPRLPRWTALSLLALSCLAGSPSTADEPDPDPPVGKLKVLDQPEDKARPPDVIFVPTPQEVVDKMLEAAKVTKKDVLFSLGCGDGRYMVAASKRYGCRSVGFDIDPDRVRDSKRNIEQNKLGKLAHVRQRDIFKLDLSEATVVTLYLLPDLNGKLVPQLEKMKKGSRVVTQTFTIPGYKEDKKETVTTKEGTQYDIYLYTIPL